MTDPCTLCGVARESMLYLEGEAYIKEDTYRVKPDIYCTECLPAALVSPERGMPYHAELAVEQVPVESDHSHSAFHHENEARAEQLDSVAQLADIEALLFSMQSALGELSETYSEGQYSHVEAPSSSRCHSDLQELMALGVLLHERFEVDDDDA